MITKSVAPTQCQSYQILSSVVGTCYNFNVEIA